MKIAKSEGFTLDQVAVDRLIESSGNDIRQIINILQMWNNQAATGKKSLLSTVAKDGKVMLSNFEAAS
jgi:DNA polymerase III delta prime subunit